MRHDRFLLKKAEQVIASQCRQKLCPGPAGRNTKSRSPFPQRLQRLRDTGWLQQQPLIGNNPLSRWNRTALQPFLARGLRAVEPDLEMAKKPVPDRPLAHEELRGLRHFRQRFEQRETRVRPGIREYLREQMMEVRLETGRPAQCGARFIRPPVDLREAKRILLVLRAQPPCEGDGRQMAKIPSSY